MTVVSYISTRGGGGGGALRYRGGPQQSYVFRGGRGLFLRPPHVRDFVKEGYFFVSRYEVWGGGGGENPLTIHEIYAALTPSDSQRDWASEFDAVTCCRETGRRLWNLKLKYVLPFIQCQCFDKRRGVCLLEKASVFIK